MIISTMHDHDFDAEGCDYDEEEEGGGGRSSRRRRRSIGNMWRVESFSDLQTTGTDFSPSQLPSCS